MQHNAPVLTGAGGKRHHGPFPGLDTQPLSPWGNYVAAAQSVPRKALGYRGWLTDPAETYQNYYWTVLGAHWGRRWGKVVKPNSRLTRSAEDTDALSVDFGPIAWRNRVHGTPEHLLANELPWFGDAFPHIRHDLMGPRGTGALQAPPKPYGF